MQKIFLIAVLLALSANVSIAQDKVIKWANDSLILDEYDTIIRKTGNQLEGKLEVKNYRSKSIYEIRSGFIQSKCTYTFNGIKKEEINFNNRAYDGKYRFWNDLGILLIEGQYKNGLKEGKWRFYYNDGQKQMEGHFLADSSSLVEAFQYERTIAGDEDVRVELVWRGRDAPADGEWYIYDRSGRQLQTLVFKKGVLVGYHLAY